MNTRFFEYAVEVEKQKSISAAAKALYMGQPNLSKAIQELEKTFNIKIFRRTPSGVTPTAEGKAFLRRAARILNEIDAIEKIPSSISEPTAFRITIPNGAYLNLAAAKLFLSLDDIAESSFDVMQASSVQSIDAVTSGRFPLGVIRYYVEDEVFFKQLLKERGLSSNTICTFKTCVVFSRNNPLAKTETLNPPDLKLHTEIVNDEYSIPYVRNQSDSNLTSQFNDSAPKCSVNIHSHIDTLVLLSASNDAYVRTSPLPKYYLDKFGLVQRYNKNEKDARDTLIYSDNYIQSDLDKSFFSMLDSVLKNMENMIPPDSE